MGAFDQIDAAFAPLFDRKVVVRGRRNDAPVRQTVEACVFEGADDDPVDDNSVQAGRRTVEVLIPFSAWRFDSPPQIGDEVELPSGNQGAIPPTGSQRYLTFMVEPCLAYWRLVTRGASP